MNESGLNSLDEITSSASPGNLTASFTLTQHHPVTTVIETYFIPMLCLFGLIGNSIASLVFLQKQLRNSSSSIFLATRGISDNGFLSTLFIIWISRTFHLQLGALPGACTVIIFLTYVCGCVSVWLVVFVTFENYIRICRPFIVNSVCKTSTAKLSVLVLCLIVIGFYTFPFWAMNEQCMPSLEYYNVVQALVYTDTVITLVIPLICITILMITIVCDLVKSFNRRNKLLSPSVSRVKNPMAAVTKMLLSVTITFFCLNLPSHINRLRLMVSSLLDDSDGKSSLSSGRDEVAIQQITLLLSYLSLTLNIVVYLVFGSKFRTVFLQLVMCKCCASVLKFSSELTSSLHSRKEGTGSGKEHLKETFNDITVDSTELTLLQKTSGELDKNQTRTDL